MSYQQIIETMKRLGLIDEDYDDQTAAREFDVFEVDRCIFVGRRDYSLRVSEESDSGETWYGVSLTKNAPKERVFSFHSPVQGNWREAGDEQPPETWYFEVTQCSEADTFTQFSRHLLAMLFRRRLSEVTLETVSSLLRFVPEAEREDPESLFMERAIEDFLGWFKALP